MKRLAIFALVAAISTPPAIAAAPDNRAEAIERLRQAFGAESRQGWQIGPIIRGRSYSPGMPSRATPYGSGFVIDFPTRPQHHVHYVTKPVRSLAGAQSITVRYRIDAAPGARFVPQARPNERATVSLYFQRAGDDWSATGRQAYYRWYAPPDKMERLANGDYQMTVSLDDPRWIGVKGGVSAGNSAREFQAAKANASRVGLVFGSASLRGHGVYATAPARIVVTDFNIR